MPSASCLCPTLSAPSQTSPQLLFVCFVASCGILSHKSNNPKAKTKKQESKSKNPKQQRTHYHVVRGPRMGIKGLFPFISDAAPLAIKETKLRQRMTCESRKAHLRVNEWIVSFFIE